MIVAESLRRKRKITSTTRTSVSSSVNFTSSTDARIDVERSYRTWSEAEAGSCFWNVGSSLRTASATATVFVAGLLEDRERDRALVVVPGGGLVVLDAVDDFGEVAQADRGAVAVRDDHGPVPLRVQDLPVGLDGERRQRPVEDPRRQVDVGAAHGVGDLVDADAAAGELPRVDHDAHGVLLRAVDLDLRHARDGRDALRHHDLAVLVELGQRQRLRGQREVDHGLVGRVDLSVGRRRGHVRRAAAARRPRSPTARRARRRRGPARG